MTVAACARLDARRHSQIGSHVGRSGGEHNIGAVPGEMLAAILGDHTHTHTRFQEHWSAPAVGQKVAASASVQE